MKIKKGDKVIIKGSAEKKKYQGCIFEVLSEPYNICGWRWSDDIWIFFGV